MGCKVKRLHLKIINGRGEEVVAGTSSVIVSDVSRGRRVFSVWVQSTETDPKSDAGADEIIGVNVVNRSTYRI